MAEAQELTEQEAQLIQRENVNLTAINRKAVLRDLTRIGIPDARAREIIEANEPRFKVYGVKSEGAIAQQSRIEEAKSAGLPSTTKASVLIAKGYSPGGFEYTTEEGKRYVGGRRFIEQKAKAEEKPITGTITTIPPRRLAGVTATQEGPIYGGFTEVKDNKYIKIYEESYRAYRKAGQTKEMASASAIDITRMKAGSEGLVLTEELQVGYSNLPLSKSITPEQFGNLYPSPEDIPVKRKQPDTTVGKIASLTFSIPKGAEKQIEDVAKGLGRFLGTTAKTVGYYSIKYPLGFPFGTGELPEKIGFKTPTYEEKITTAKATGLIAIPLLFPPAGIVIGSYFSYNLAKSTYLSGKTSIETFKSGDWWQGGEIVGRTAVLGGATLAIGIPTFQEIVQTTRGLFSIGKVKQYTPTLAEQKAVEGFSRQRPTVILRTEKGGYVLGKTKGTGEIISFGGVAKRGESFKSGALRELREETGLKGIKLKYLGKQITPEETFRIYTGTITNQQLKKIAPSSDISEIIVIPKWRASLMKGITGQTAMQPVSRLSLYPFGKIRSYETGIINYIETGEPLTWLTTKTKMGTFVLGTQSRYDVPWINAKLYEKATGKELYTHGTPNPPFIEGVLSGSKQAQILAEKFERGTAPGLYIQPPIYASKSAEGYVGLSYLGFGTGKEISGVKFGIDTRTALIFKEKSAYPIISTPKARIGMESERVIDVGSIIETAGKAETRFIGFKTVYFQPTRILKGGDPTGKVISSSFMEDYGKNFVYVSPSIPGSLVSESLSRARVSPIRYRSSGIRPSEVSISEFVPSGITSSPIRPSPISPSRVRPSPVKPSPISPSLISPSPISPSLVSPSLIPPSKIKSVEFPISKILPPEKYKIYPKQIRRISKFPVALRRFGQFKLIGFGKTPKEAISIGSRSASTNLGATFKVIGLGPQKVPRFKTKVSKKEGLVYIQYPKYRLSAPTEKREIQYYRGLGRRRTFQ